MINIASLHYFNLLEKLTAKYKRILDEVIQNITQYLNEEGFEIQTFKKDFNKYELVSLGIKYIGMVQFYKKKSREKKYYYYPSFFCEIYIDSKYISSMQNRKKVIFLLSNLFECFDEFDENNLLIEFHRDIENSYYENKEYRLRHDFVNINSLSELYEQEDILSSISQFSHKNKNRYSIPEIRDRFPEIYRALIYFMYNIFALEKSYLSSTNKMRDIQIFESQNGEHAHTSLSSERLKLNTKSLENVLSRYQQSFEKFLDIIVK